MEEFIRTNEMVLRLTFFAITFIFMAIYEIFSPRRVQSASKTKRWATNISIIFLGTVLAKSLGVILPVGMADLAASNGWGLLNNISLSPVLSIIVGVVILDFIIYLQHVLFHSIPLLWRLHMVHHIDPNLDVSSGNRFHPIEILISIFIKLAVITLVGPSAVTVIIFEIILNGMAQFNHSNVKLPKLVDSILRLFVVTPDVHIVHHSVIRQETNSNYGFNLTIWDRVFGTYKAHPKKGCDKLDVGLEHIRDPRATYLIPSLLMPFVKKRYSKGKEYSING